LVLGAECGRRLVLGAECGRWLVLGAECGRRLVLGAERRAVSRSYAREAVSRSRVRFMAVDEPAVLA
jgi:hypothetical protein